jgi:hypothetical protein
VSRPRIVATTLIVVIAAATAFVAPVVSVLALLVALNFVLGPGENVPFSTYPMFSEPTVTTWGLSFEHPDGTSLPIAMMGFNPQLARKRFATEMGVARSRGVVDVTAVRQYAAEVLASEIQEHKGFRGVWSAKPISVVFVEYRQVSGELVKVHTPMAQTTTR